MSKTNQRAPSEPEAHACPPAQPSVYPVVYSRRWLCRAHGIPSLPVMPRPNTGLKCNGGQGVAPQSTTAAAGSLHQGDVLLSCGVVRVQDALHPIKMWTDTPCLSTGPRGYPGHLPLDSQGSIWPCGSRCMSPKHLTTCRWDNPAMGISTVDSVQVPLPLPVPGVQS